jgi:hypothetical protein
MATPSITKGQRVMYNGKEYSARFDSFVDMAHRNSPKYHGMEVVYLQPINAKTGKPWQAYRLQLVSDCEMELTQG